MMILKPFYREKKVFIFSLLCFWFNVSLLGQNLVPNFGFEDYSNCPSWEEVEKCTGWSKASNSSSTPDYFNACAPSNTVGIPQSFFLYQTDHRNCSAYMGLVTWTNNPNEREQIGVQLSQSMVIGQTYHLSFYSVMGGSDDGSFYYESPSNNIGLRLSTVSYSSSNPAPIDNFSHLRSVSIISDTANWVRISGSIIADSAYNYLIIGNFYDDANTDTTTLNCGNCINNYSYYLVDDVCISTDSTLCNGGIDGLPCTVSVEENNFDKQFTLYPNPANDFVTIQGSFDASFDISVFNSIGQQLYAEENANNLKLNISQYNYGLFFIKITSQGNQFMYKLLKQ
ncbi:MAG: T9SS type A sorting domain-containing protein [Bacteroidetes bacterium]|nr:MAG: T9SS type A sorting domain-containing protein [Bacteroidota bacterium]